MPNLNLFQGDPITLTKTRLAELHLDAHTDGEISQQIKSVKPLATVISGTEA